MPAAGTLGGVTGSCLESPDSPSRERGTASVELVGVLPVLVIAVLVVAQLAVAGFTFWSAGVAARAGARSALIGEDAEEAARAALPGLLRRGAEVEDSGDVAVEVVVPRVLPVLPKVKVDVHAALEPGDAS